MAQSRKDYDKWFFEFAPPVFKEQRVQAMKDVPNMLKKTNNLQALEPAILARDPGIVRILRMATTPPIARDRLIALARVDKNLITSMEGDEDNAPQTPPQMKGSELTEQLGRVVKTIQRLLDLNVLPWVQPAREPKPEELGRAVDVLVDRTATAMANPRIRNAQENRQTNAIGKWLEARDYKIVPPKGLQPRTMQAGTFALHMPVKTRTKTKTPKNVSVDVVVMPHGAEAGTLPLLVEAKAAGDETNTNKRSKEEIEKAGNLREEFGAGIPYIVFLCGYFGEQYLTDMAGAGVDWVWEHRVSDLQGFGV